jgi:hypothetical protein
MDKRNTHTQGCTVLFLQYGIRRRKKPIALVRKKYLYQRNDDYYTVEHFCIILDGKEKVFRKTNTI